MKIIIILSLLLTPAIIFGQVRKVSTVRKTTEKPTTDTTIKRHIPPRMNTAERSRIKNPDNGQTIYNINTKTYETFNGKNWYATKHFLGEQFGGGIIYQLKDNGTHGMIISKFDLNCAVQWYNGVNKKIIVYNEEVFLTGAEKTALIVAAQTGDNPNGIFAARLCADYSVKENGQTYNDWFLPTYGEFYYIHVNKKYIQGLSDFYWTTDEYQFTQDAALTYSFEFGDAVMAVKLELRPVRAIRTF